MTYDPRVASLYHTEAENKRRMEMFPTENLVNKLKLVQDKIDNCSAEREYPSKEDLGNWLADLTDALIEYFEKKSL